ncbi:hypothetical protein RW64_04095 [Geobacter sulfurreducens]|nr:hypothetical protein RW64_04095 [Geobacter sulfurreducens]
MNLLRHAVAGLCLVASAGCSGQDVIVRKQSEMETRLEHLHQASTTSGVRLAELSAEVTALRERLAAQGAELEQIKAGQRELQANITERLAQVAPAAGTPSRIEVVSRDGAPREKDGPPDAYLKAFGLYSANNFAGAVEAFQAFLAEHPDSEYAGNALYWIGECHYSRSDLPRALDAFRLVAERYPASTKVPDALLKSGYTLYAMKEPERAREILESLAAKYPRSPAAAKARERLAVATPKKQ